MFELAKQQEGAPLKTAQIAEAQAIPLRFLEIILNRLKRAGLLEAKRGYTGGYRITRTPHEITVGQVFQALEDANEATACVSCISKSEIDCPMHGNCAFMPLWLEMQNAIDTICSQTTIQKLLDNEMRPEDG